MSGRIAAFVTITAKPGKGDEVLATLRTMFDGPVGGEEGTLVYAMHRSVDDPDTILFYELYADSDALGAHGTSDALKQIGAALRELVTGRPEMVLATPVEDKGLPR